MGGLRVLKRDRRVGANSGRALIDVESIKCTHTEPSLYMYIPASVHMKIFTPRHLYLTQGSCHQRPGHAPFNTECVKVNL